MTSRSGILWLISFFLCGAALAQSYPVRPVRLIVPYPPGGATDIVARGIAQKLSAGFDQQVVVDNRGGGGQIIGTDLVAKAAPNGYTILLASVTHSINPSLHANLPYDSVRDFTPVTLIGTGPNVIVVHPSVNARTVRELVALLKVQGEKLNYASSGNGSGGHLAAELFKSMTGVRMTHIPYKGGGPAYVDLIAGQVGLMFTSPVPTIPFVKAGKLRAIATTGARRTGAMPHLPTVAESGVPGYEASLWYAIFAPAGTPKDIVAKLHAEIVKGLQSADLRDRIVGLGIDISAGDAARLSAHLQAEIAKWARVIKEANITAD